MNNKKSLDCDIVCDLLELYHDKVVRETTAAAVKEHLTECESCRNEYEKIKEALPSSAESSTKKEFSKLMKKKKIKQIVTTVICCLLACLILTSSYLLLTKAHLKVTDVQVHQVYRYRAPDNNDYFFVMYSYEDNSSSSPRTEVKREMVNDEERTTIIFDRMIPLILKNDYRGTYSDIAFFRADTVSTEKQGVISGLDCDELVFCGDVIWTKETNSDDEVPDYVAAYYDFEHVGNKDEFSSGDAVSFGYECDPDNSDSPDNYFYVSYPDKTIWWNIEGDMIKETHKDVPATQVPEAE